MGATALAASPPNVTGGQSVTATWSNMPYPHPTDSISYSVSLHDALPIFDYVRISSCTHTPGSTAPASGSCPFVMPTTAGTYQQRLFTSNNSTHLAISDVVTVT